LSIKDIWYVDATYSDRVFYFCVLGNKYGITYRKRMGGVDAWFWLGDFSCRGVDILFDELPDDVQEKFSDPFLEIEFERFKLSGKQTMDLI